MDRYSLELAFINARTVFRHVQAVANADFLLAPSCRTRLAIKFFCTQTAAFVSIFPMTLASQGIGIQANGTFGFSQWFDGDISTNEWHGFAAAATALITVVEVLATCPCPTGHGAEDW